MINDKQNSSYQEQKKVRPDLEIVINEFLEGDTLKTALDFIALLKKNKTAPRWSSTNTWNVKYKRNDAKGNVCYIKAGKGYWNVLFGRGNVEGYEDFAYADALSENTWYGKMDYVKRCPGGRCHNNCASGRRKIICGIQYEDVCWCMQVIFHNPNGKELECINELIEYRKNDITQNT